MIQLQGFSSFSAKLSWWSSCSCLTSIALFLTEDTEVADGDQKPRDSWDILSDSKVELGLLSLNNQTPC